MPWEDIGKLTDQDLKDMFAFSCPFPHQESVPQPIPPAGEKR